MAKRGSSFRKKLFFLSSNTRTDEFSPRKCSSESVMRSWGINCLSDERCGWGCSLEPSRVARL